MSKGSLGQGQIRDILDSHPHTLIIGETNSEGKALGVPPELVDELIALDQIDAVICEADGSRSRPFKAPGENEPVVPGSTTLQVPVVGIDAVGALLDDALVHRPEAVARLVRAALESVVTPELIAKVIEHPQGGLKNKPLGARAIALVNKVLTDDQLEDAREIAMRLLQSGSIEAVAIAAANNVSNPVRETHRRIAVVVTAAGAGTRMQGRVKQLLPWRGKTLIENAIKLRLCQMRMKLSSS
jgi:probable selenium-dependent hydroxylase accessory protein YqeC